MEMGTLPVALVAIIGVVVVVILGVLSTRLDRYLHPKQKETPPKEPDVKGKNK